jgi:ubiquinone/menaquinone biosynthesis C-methylase UbiE
MNKLAKNSRPSSFALTPRAKVAIKLHKNVPANWYEYSVKHNVFQRYWHWRRFENVKRFIGDINGNVLDIGCCDGYFTNFILQNSQAKHLTGIDVLKHAITYAQKRYRNEDRLTFQLGEAHALQFKDKAFDHIFCLEALEHVEDPLIVLKEMRRVLKPGGKIHILIPAENMLFKVIWAAWTHYRGKIWHGSHLHEYENDEVLRYIKKAGFKVKVNHKFLGNMLQFVIAQ